MTGRGLCVIAAMVAGTLLASCQSLNKGNATLRTDETRGALSTACRDIAADHDAEGRVAALCRCLDTKRDAVGFSALIKTFCDDGGGAAYFARLAKTLNSEGDFVMRRTSGEEPSAADRFCLNELAAYAIESRLEFMMEACTSTDLPKLRSLITLPKAAPPEACRRLRRMDADQCFVESPCDDSSAAAERAICNPRVQAIHRLKDPTRANTPFNYAFAQLLSGGQASARITYGAANCHGTAQALAGGLFEDMPVRGLTFHGSAVEEQCGAKAAAALAAAKEKTGRYLPIDKGGYVVNMNHDSQCPATACGEASFHTFSCSDGWLNSHVFIDGMCISCWDAILQRAGFKPLPVDETWTALRPGCVLTAKDHTVTIVYENDGLCYVYESLSPFAPPQLNVADCPTLFASFPRRWCR